MKKISIIVMFLILSTAVNCLASGVYYLPDVTSEMSSPSFWTNETDILMSYDEIEKLNEQTILTKETNMYDLKNLPETVDGVALNEAILKSSKADASYYLGWTYLESKKKATQKDYYKITNNTQNLSAKRVQKVLYGIATKRTELRTLPSDIAIWDDPNDSDFDYQYLVGVRVNEPVVITSRSRDGKYYLAKSICCSGWIPADAVAICKDKEEWISAWDIEEDDALIVWGDKVFCESSIVGAETSDLMLTMGTVLKLEKDIDPNELIDNRSAYNNFAVWIPVRNEDGTYSKKLTLISEHKKVSKGYLPLTKANISKVVFSVLGNTYGWGGSLYSDDCSGYMRNVYKCFGIELARNTTWQTAMPMATIDMRNIAKEDRIRFLDAVPFGTILYFSGHEMMYLGSKDGKYYVISAVGSIMQPENATVRQRIRSTVVNTLDVKRANGNTWFDEITVALVPYFSVDNNKLPEYEWYHDGVVYCLKNKIMKGDTDKFFNPSKNVTWAELLQILYNIEGIKGEAKEGSLWYDLAVLWAKDSNLIYENDLEFNPESEISREQLASVLYLYAKFKGYDVGIGEETNILSYDDVFDISEYAIPAMQYAVGAGIIAGKSISTLNPKDNTTRAEIAVILERFLEKNKQK
ncbi:MAG: SH3 domain-containing protein [Clostridia bacterium]|nr:SH3 domain-containing protein [Clostridia bacterium]